MPNINKQKFVNDYREIRDTVQSQKNDNYIAQQPGINIIKCQIKEYNGTIDGKQSYKLDILLENGVSSVAINNVFTIDPASSILAAGEKVFVLLSPGCQPYILSGSGTGSGTGLFYAHTHEAFIASAGD